jgi:hypothetical protein
MTPFLLKILTTFLPYTYSTVQKHCRYFYWKGVKIKYFPYKLALPGRVLAINITQVNTN